jgi:protoporphyrinogen oxidase
MSDIYWLNIHDPHTPFVGIIEHTNLASPDQYDGKHIIYLSKYMRPSHPFWTLDTEELFSEYRPQLDKMFPEFSPDSIIAMSRQAARWAQPVILKNYSQFLPEIQTPVNGLYFCSMAHIYPEDRGINYSVLKGNEASQLMMGTQI